MVVFFFLRILFRGFCILIQDALLPVADANHLDYYQTHKMKSSFSICYLQSCQLDFVTATSSGACAAAVFTWCSKWTSYSLRPTRPWAEAAPPKVSSSSPAARPPCLPEPTILGRLLQWELRCTALNYSAQPRWIINSWTVLFQSYPPSFPPGLFILKEIPNVMGCRYFE